MRSFPLRPMTSGRSSASGTTFVPRRPLTRISTMTRSPACLTARGAAKAWLLHGRRAHLAPRGAAFGAVQPFSGALLARLGEDAEVVAGVRVFYHPFVQRGRLLLVAQHRQRHRLVGNVHRLLRLGRRGGVEAG